MADTSPPTGRPTILVVDDTPQNLSLMSDLLEEMNYAVKLAPSGARALKIATGTPLPDLILLDIMMPEMDGYDVCRALKVNPATRDIPVIFLTALDAMEDEERGLKAGALDYITKPISPSILLARVRNQLALKEALDKLRAQNQQLEEEKVRVQEFLRKLKDATDKLLVQNRQLKQEQLRARDLIALLGDTYQTHVDLDRVWEKLQQFPLDDPMMEDLYKLAQEFERKSQPDKTAAVLSHMAGFNPHFRDIATRLSLLRPSTDNGTPRSLGRYQIGRELGKGEMGAVYLGTDPKIGRVVAIKTLTLATAANADAPANLKELFFREAESAGRLTHPNIVAIYDVVEDHGLAFIAMEYLKGDNLTAYTKPDKLLPLEKALSIVERVAEALAYAHTHGVVHRDIKPANILYDPGTDSVKVTDFGIAVISGAPKADGDLILGTPSYMSPEQAIGHPVDGRSDLYSLGVTLYLLACGHLPFRRESLAQLMAAITSEAHADILAQNRELPGGIVTLINKALAKDPAQRFQSGLEMAKAVNLFRRSQMVFK